MFLWNYFQFGPVVQEEMSYKDISYLELWWPFYSTEQNHLCNFMRNISEIILNLDQWTWRRCCFKDISNLELWWPICLARWNHLCNFGSGHPEEHFCEIILNLDSWFR